MCKSDKLINVRGGCENSRPTFGIGGNPMNTIEKEKIRYLRGEGLGYKAIASRLELSVDAVKGYCRRSGLDSNMKDCCLQCGNPFTKKPGAEQKRFCSGVCRSAWWRRHNYLATPKEENKRVCAHCGHVFYSSPSAKRKYCGRSCFYAARFGGELS
jgi:hypothetical protein